MLKISGGTLKNRTLATKLTNEKPTMEKTRQVMFNILSHNILFQNFNIENAEIMDLFCGSGVVGFEFLSRGAKKCFFIDQNIHLTKQIHHNAEKMNINEQCMTHTCNILTNTSYIYNLCSFADIIFIDPPYSVNHSDIIKLISDIPNNKNQLIIYEHKNPINTNNDKIVLSRNIGSNIYLSFWII